MSILTLIVPAIAVLLIAAPLVSVAQGKVTGKSAIRNRFALHFGAFALACICAVASWAPMLRVWASWLPLW